MELALDGWDGRFDCPDLCVRWRWRGRDPPYVASPVAESLRPGIVLVHHMPGWDEFYFEFAERLARHGYEVICPDLYCRFGHGLPDDVYAKVRSEGGVHDDSVVADAAAALAWLQARPSHNGRVGILGTPARVGGTPT